MKTRSLPSKKTQPIKTSSQTYENKQFLSIVLRLFRYSSRIINIMQYDFIIKIIIIYDNSYVDFGNADVDFENTNPQKTRPIKTTSLTCEINQFLSLVSRFWMDSGDFDDSWILTNLMWILGLLTWNFRFWTPKNKTLFLNLFQISRVLVNSK